MATADGAVAPSAFARRALRTAVESAAITPIVCCISLVPLALNGSLLGQFALATYIGLVASMAGYAGRENPKRVGELDEPRYVNLVRSVVLFLYFNAIIFTGAFVGLALTMANYPELAFVAAALVPSVDAALARVGMPSLGLAGSVIIAAAELVGEFLSWVRSDSSLAAALQHTREYVTDIDAIYGEYQIRLDGAVAVWR